MKAPLRLLDLQRGLTAAAIITGCTVGVFAPLPRTLADYRATLITLALFGLTVGLIAALLAVRPTLARRVDTPAFRAVALTLVSYVATALSVCLYLLRYEPHPWALPEKLATAAFYSLTIACLMHLVFVPTIRALSGPGRGR